ncbi:hypothetical protein TRFO_36688 [Tritrichomonas foetus]|uniref:MatE family protein n=1 Tax=Tritrichomonas foetus TaxID=1144522 RepID=A0A1J4JFU3_9EUKA|nr:hypothetical protein TRFO_36688 [Tritrichomonas foetus]|eukprot:OHS97159.1 hypothetical protein TRFO_36688 [Tritrichomonas foetus]
MSSISTYSTGSEEIFIENISSIEDKDKEIENSRFTKHSPLVTLLKMTAGPFALFLQTFLSTLNMFFIAKRFNNEPESHAVEIIGFANQFLTILNFIGNYFGISLTSHVSTLIGKGDRNEAAHLSVDIFRISLLFSFAGAFGLLFAVKPFLNFIGTPSQLIDSTAKYTNFMVLTTPFGNMFLVLIFFMQSIGNSAASGIISLIMRTIITLGLTPLFLFVFKVSTTFMN